MKPLNLPGGLLRVRIRMKQYHSEEEVFCEYAGVDDSIFPGEVYCSNCGKELRNAHCFNIFQSIESYQNSPDEYETWLFGSECVKSSIKLIEVIIPGKRWWLEPQWYDDLLKERKENCPLSERYKQEVEE